MGPAPNAGFTTKAGKFGQNMPKKKYTAKLFRDTLSDFLLFPAKICSGDL